MESCQALLWVSTMWTQEQHPNAICQILKSKTLHPHPHVWCMWDQVVPLNPLSRLCILIPVHLFKKPFLSILSIFLALVKKKLDFLCLVPYAPHPLSSFWTCTSPRACNRVVSSFYTHENNLKCSLIPKEVKETNIALWVNKGAKHFDWRCVCSLQLPNEPNGLQWPMHFAPGTWTVGLLGFGSC